MNTPHARRSIERCDEGSRQNATQNKNVAFSLLHDRVKKIPPGVRFPEGQGVTVRSIESRWTKAERLDN